MNTAVDQFISQHWLALVVGYFMFSNFVSAMPSPNGTAPLNAWWYRWAFNFLHLCAGNVARIAATMLPKLEPPKGNGQ